MNTVNVKKQPLSAGVKRGLARAFRKFSAYELAKYDRDGPVRLRDVLFLCHARPRDAEQDALWKSLIAGTLPVPQTWETILSAAGKAPKKETWQTVIDTWVTEDQGMVVRNHFAILRNLRNILQAGVSEAHMDKLRRAFSHPSWANARLLPFRFIAAAKHAPKMEDAIGEAMLLSAANLDKLPGRTLLIVDTSGSMHGGLSGKSEMSRLDAAAGLAILAREVCQHATVYATAGNDGRRKHATMELPARRGFALSDSIKGVRSSIGGGGIFLVQCLDYIAGKEPQPFDRVIIFTDEQDCEKPGVKPTGAKQLGRFNYIVNVAAEKNGIGYQSGWHHIDGFSEAVLTYVREYEEFESETVAQ